MKQTITAAILLIMLFAQSDNLSADGGKDSIFTKHFNASLFAISEKGQVSIEILLDDKEYKTGKDLIGIVVHDSRDRDVEGAKLSVIVSGSSDLLNVKEEGDGLYFIRKSGLPEKENWQLKIAVKKGRIDDNASFLFPEVMKRMQPAGKYTFEGMRSIK